LFRDSREKIRSFFLRSYILAGDVDRFIAQHAQDLFWDHNAHGLMPKDAVHLATALDRNAQFLETYDSVLLGLNDRFPTLEIQHPGSDLANPLSGGMETTGQRIFDARKKD